MVEAVLVMALVTTIGIFVIASRVAGSRQSASSSSLSLAARQAAEFGYTEVVAEMNRDSKSYLWVTKSSEWNNVSEQDLKTCGVAATEDPATNRFTGLGSERALPNSPELSYRFVSYQEPAKEPDPDPDPDPDPSVPEVCNSKYSKFGNLIGGTGEITIVGTFKRGSGYTSTFTLKRKVSVKRAAPIFNNPITAIPANRSFDPADSRFPNYLDAADPTKVAVAYPGTPTGTYVEISCEPGSSTDEIKCTAGTSTANFKSATATASGSGNDYFPYSGGSPWGPCQQVGANVRCLVKSMTVKANTNMLVATKKGTTEAPVEIFLSENMTIEPLAKLAGEDSGDGKGWSRFRIFGVTAGASCGSQTITINPYLNTPTPATIPPTFNETNLQNAFLWLNKGKLKYQTSTALDRIPALVGSVCQFESAVAGPSTLSTLSNRRFLEGLGGAYAFSGLFGAPNPIRFFYRGFGSED
ncbi:MAG: hypothetical protein WCP63_00760 [Cyanobium sp. ELA712]